MRKTAALLSLALVGAAFGKSEEGMRLPDLPRMPGGGPVMKGLKIHEWGVFLVGNKDAARASAGGEPPTFIQRIKMPALPEQEPSPSAEKPVLHIYPPGPIDLSVCVAFPEGTPKLAWPRGTPEWREHGGAPAPGLSWTLQVLGETKRKDAPPLEVPKDHWIAACRKVGSSRVVSGPDYDSFLFYEGEVAQIRQKVTVGRNEDGYSLTAATIDQAWIVEAGAEGLAVLHETGMVRDPGDEELRRARPVRPCAPEALRGDLAKSLASAGLSDAEAACVLDIWMPELVKPGKRLVYLLPRAEYDRLLPIAFDPTPEELKRVGLVLQEL